MTAPAGGKSPLTAPTVERFATHAAMERLFEVLQRRGCQVVGPTLDQPPPDSQAIIYAPLRSAADLPRGWTDEQAPGVYRLHDRGDGAWFNYVVGPHAWKQFLFPPQVTLSTAERTEQGWRFETPEDEPPRYALLGVRACELAAMRVQDRVFLAGPYVDPIYQRRRTAALVIAVNCTGAAATCFCTSTGTGPRCAAGFDIALTELSDGMILETATAEGDEIVAELETSVATIDQRQAAEQARARAVEQIQRRLDTNGLRDLLLDNLEHPRWEQVAERCLSCTNCTMVCPTCFCSSVHEVSDLTGDHVTRERQWDSCFQLEFSYMNGGRVRDTVRSRYRQWLTHKLASWVDQFGDLGCVGCGRCITWCPVGIDLTEEVAAIRGGES